MHKLMMKMTALLAMTTPVAATPQEDAWREQIAAALHLPETLPAVAAASHGQFEPEPGVLAKRITYATLHGMRVPAILYLPRNPAPRIPALIVVNGHGGDKYSWSAFYMGVLGARGGVAVLTYDPLGEGERNPERKSGTRAHDKLEMIPALGLQVASQMISDVRQAVSYLVQRPEIDPQRISAVGNSMGSFVLALAGAVETRLHACVLVGGGNLDGPGGYWDGSKPLCQGWPYQALRGLGDRGAVIYALHAARGPTFIFNGTEDEVVAISRMGEPFFQDLQRRTAKLRGGAGGVFEYGFKPEVSHRTFFVTKPVALWLERTVDFPRWSAADIEAMPETRIGTWAREGGYALDPLYATEVRSGGTRALGANIPLLSRAQLSVFPPAEWEAAKSSLTIDYWERAVRPPRNGGR